MIPAAVHDSCLFINARQPKYCLSADTGQAPVDAMGIWSTVPSKQGQRSANGCLSYVHRGGPISSLCARSGARAGPLERVRAEGARARAPPQQHPGAPLWHHPSATHGMLLATQPCALPKGVTLRNLLCGCSLSHDRKESGVCIGKAAPRKLQI